MQPSSIYIDLKPDELFTSWLIRSALAQGCSPLDYTNFLWPNWRAWTIDLDRGVSPSKLHLLARHTQHDKKLISQSFVYSPIITRAIKGILPWVNSLGARNRKRAGGLNYCPECLKDESYYRLHWRYSWYTFCSTHNSVLLDRCPECYAAVMPHRLHAKDEVITLCSICKISLTNAPKKIPHENALRFQSLAYDAVNRSGAHANGLFVTTNEWFTTAALFVSLIRRAKAQRAQTLTTLIDKLEIQPSIRNLGDYGQSLEKMNNQTRHDTLALSSSLMTMELPNLLETLITCGVSRPSFLGDYTTAPDNLSYVVDSLPRRVQPNPCKQTPESQARSIKTISARYARLERRLAMYR